MFDGKQFGEDLVVLVKGFMARELEPIKVENAALKERLATLEGVVAEQDQNQTKFAAEFGTTLGQMVADAIAAIELPEPKGVDPEQLTAAVNAAVEALPKPEDGKSVTIEELQPVVAAEVDRAVGDIVLPEPKEVDLEQLEALVKTAVDAIPKPEDGKSVTVEELQPVVAAEVDRAVSEIQLPEPKEVDPDELKGLIQAAVDALPKPEDGRSVEPEDLRPIVLEEVERAVEALPKPKDGDPGKAAANIVDAVKDDGELVLTMEDGRLIRTGIRDGERGSDGLGFDDMDLAVLDDDRTIELSFRRGDEEKVFTAKWPVTIDRGVFKGGREYAAGDGVTWAGSYWIAQRDTNEKPDMPDSGWRLAVKKGRDGQSIGKGTN